VRKTLFSITGLLLSGCCRLIPDPAGIGDTPPGPGKFWDPGWSNWYCDDRYSTATPEKTLEINENSDIAALLDTALSNHPLTKQAWAQARSSAYQLGMVQSANFPTVSGYTAWQTNDRDFGQGSASGTTTSSGSVQGKTNSVIFQLSATYLLLDFGGRSASIESARQALFAVNWSQNRTIQQVIINVIQGYYQYVSAKEQVIAVESDLKNALSSLDSAENLFNAGVGKYLDVLQAKSNVENVQLNLIVARGQVEIFLAQLATALGIPPSTKIDTAALPDKFPLDEMTLSLEDLMLEAKKNRPDLASAWATMLQKQQDIQVGISAGMPNLTGSVNAEKTKYVWHSNLVTHNYNAVIQLNIPIFEGFFYVNQVRKAKEDLRAAKANYENLESFALLDVITSYTNFYTAKTALISSEESLKFAQEARDVAYGSYGAGTASFLDLLAADSALALAKSRNINARTGLAVALFNIGFATGTLNVPYVTQAISEREKFR
jgi:outer membrane protein